MFKHFLRLLSEDKVLVQCLDYDPSGLYRSTGISKIAWLQLSVECQATVITKNGWVSFGMAPRFNKGTLNGFVEELNEFFLPHGIGFTLHGLPHFPYLKWRRITIEERVQILLERKI